MQLFSLTRSLVSSKGKEVLHKFSTPDSKLINYKITQPYSNEVEENFGTDLNWLMSDLYERHWGIKIFGQKKNTVNIVDILVSYDIQKTGRENKMLTFLFTG